ncbi:MAG: EamA family transporter [Bacteroidota bacterium]
MNKDLLKAYRALACVCFFWGTTYLAIRIGIQTLPPLWLVGIRQTLAGALVCTFFLLKRQPLPSWTQLKTLFIAGFLMIVIGNGVVAWSELYIPSGLAALLCSLVPFWIIGFNLMFGYSEGLNSKTIIGLLVGLAGLFVIFYDNLKDLANPAYLAGTLAILLANAGWAGGTVYLKRQQATSTLPPLFSAGLQLLLAGLTVDVMALVGGVPFPQTFTPEALGVLAYLILFGSILAYGAYVFALTKLTSTVVSLYAYINPAVAVVLGWLILNEKMNLLTLLAMSLILAGVYIVNESFKIVSKPKVYENG